MAAPKKAREPHPAHELERLRSNLKGNAPQVAYVLRGEEFFFADKMITLLQSASEATGWDVCKHDTKDPDFDLPRLLDDLTSGALFGTARCIIVRNGGALLTKGNKLNSLGFLNAAKARIKAAEPGCVVIAAEKLRADSPFIKAMKTLGGEVYGCRKLWDSPPPWSGGDARRTELAEWLLSVARAKEVQLSLDDAAYIAAATGNDLGALLGQLDRLKEGGGESLRKLVGWDAGGSPWKIAEHLVLGDAPRAVAGLEALYRSGFKNKDGTTTVDPGGLAAMLCSAMNGKLREAVHGSQVLSDGGDLDAAARAAGLRGSYGMNEFKARVGRRKAAAWRRMFDEAGALERRTRSGATVDASDLASFAMRWAVADRRG